MQLLIPMSGVGARFQAAGYKPIKPLIPVQGKPIIEWVLAMFPGVDSTSFICRKDHLAEAGLEEALNQLCPEGQIFPIEGHKKGPVFALAQALESMNPDEPVLISYCDYYMHWDFKNFCQAVQDRGCEGAIPCYTGFHPHLLPPQNLYAVCKVDEEQNLIEIKEKHCWTSDKKDSLHSPGVYYFSSGALARKYLTLAIERGLSLNGEFYNSLVYNLLVEEGLKVWVPLNVEQFCQWGTPQDLEEYIFWNQCIEGWKK